MRKCMTIFLVFCSIGFTSSIFAANDSPIGYWQTIDDETGKPKAIVQISEDNQTLSGKILKLYPRPGHDQNEVCKSCSGERRDQKIVGMVFMEHLKQSKENVSEWYKGTILDPKNGKSYHCNLQVLNNGEKLHVRGFLGLPLFGRTQTWLRIEDPKKYLT